MHTHTHPHTRIGDISHELRVHVPFTLGGTLVGAAVIAMIVFWRVPHEVSEGLFWIAHPAHVLFSAIVTTAIYRLHGKPRWWTTLLVGYGGSVGIGTLSDCLMPFFGEWLLNLPHAHPHIGFIEMWWLVNPLALAGILLAGKWPKTKLPHAGHVLLSTAATLFHVGMAVGDSLNLLTLLAIALFLFLAVWVPCCTSDIVFPLLFAKGKTEPPVRATA